ncbi:uncharacterized protein LOC118440870 isoform X1 [Vespa mandarinia]|uniref:uncharacterized protein LOC118440870 isoform X1 n=1 Tax=Vespa mandarinia TaxID=7446 RepID=UPI00160DEDF2|nr:uncharacterized protein LOC118440870 isoform X1 [Vespa mandarinia]
MEEEEEEKEERRNLRLYHDQTIERKEKELEDSRDLRGEILNIDIYLYRRDSLSGPERQPLDMDKRAAVVAVAASSLEKGNNIMCMISFKCYIMFINFRRYRLPTSEIENCEDSKVDDIVGEDYATR